MHRPQEAPHRAAIVGREPAQRGILSSRVKRPLRLQQFPFSQRHEIVTRASTRGVPVRSSSLIA
jgi:hypothetical protein